MTIMKGSKCKSGNNFHDEPWNLSSYIMECRSSEKSEIILERHQHKEQIKVFRNICYIMFMNSMEISKGEEEIL
jgi:hypothetical protein